MAIKPMKKILYKIIIMALFFNAAIQANAGQDFVSSEKWEEYKDDHFIIYYNEDIPKTQIKTFAKECEKDYKSVLDRLGFSRTDFWSFKERAKVYIFKDKNDYLEKTGFPEFII